MLSQHMYMGSLLLALVFIGVGRGGERAQGVGDRGARGARGGDRGPGPP